MTATTWTRSRPANGSIPSKTSSTATAPTGRTSCSTRRSPPPGRSGANLPFGATTGYLNTIPVDQQAPFPGDVELEWRIRTINRWNAMATVVRRNKVSSEYGGHIASFASSAVLYDIGLNHFWRTRTEKHGGDLVFFQGHAVPGIYARSFMEGRFSEETLDNFRSETGGNGLELLSPPVADAGLLAVPDRLDGPRAADGDLPGAVHEIHAQPRPDRHGRPQGLGLPRRRRDGRAREPRRHRPRRARGARQPDLRGQLQPAAPRRAGARQRQDHPGARGHLPRRRLERDQADLGLGLGRAARQGRVGHAAPADGGDRRRRLPGLQVEGRRLHPRALLRPVPRDQGARRRHDRRGDLAAAARRPRPAQGLRRLPPRR